MQRKNNDLVKAAYAMYLTGRSLAEVGKIYGKSRQTVYDQFRVRGFALRSKRLRGLTVIDGIQFTETKDGYLRGTLPGRRRITLQKYVWEKANGPIPLRYALHFVNGNRKDCSLQNLECLPVAEIARRFSPHLNQFTSPVGSRRKKGDRSKAEWKQRFLRINSL